MNDPIAEIDATGTRQARSRAARRRGASAVEVSIVAPIFFLTIFATIEISRVVMLRNLAQDAAYQSARVCMVDGATTTEATDTANEVLAVLATRGAVVTINDGDGINQQSTTVKVAIAIPLNQNSLVLPWIFSEQSIQVVSELKTERYSGP